MIARPDNANTRVQLMLAARPGEATRLHASALAVAVAVTAQLEASVRVSLLTQVADDPFPAMNPEERAMDAVLALDGPVIALHATDVVGALRSVLVQLDDCVDRESSCAIVGIVQPIVKGPSAAMRYQYLMRRKASMSHDDYLDYYLQHHSQYAFHLNGITNYTQVHVDEERSSELRAALRLEERQFDSVTELSFESIGTFFAGVTAEAAEASSDELNFVDRAMSVSYCANDHLIRDGVAE